MGATYLLSADEDDIYCTFDPPAAYFLFQMRKIALLSAGE
jgi:hypothetical protein